MIKKKEKVRYELTSDSINFLSQIIKNKLIREKLSKCAENRIYKNSYFTHRYFLELTAEETEIILDELTADSERVGIYKNSVPIGLGSQIEGLIDIFSNEYYDEDNQKLNSLNKVDS